ncbi:GapS4a family protein [Brenneria goodwinii]|uniref:GapS4a family protein n=1 Tax=Brenneria goodwinii TaxID=1109412 RepID=UPI0036E20454
MGEFSKLVGDVGEGIVTHFLDLFGWENHATNKYVKCHTKKHQKESHGIDALFVYNSPLESKTVENVIISSKYSSNPYSSVPSTFKSHFEDIALAIECYNKSALKKEINERISIGGACRKVETGVLFYINNDDNPKKQDIISQVKNAQNNSELKYRTIHVIDNKRASFLYESITFVRNKFQNDKDRVNFFYPPTSLNLTMMPKRYFGKIFPVEYISSPIIPFVIEGDNQEQPTICMVCSEQYSDELLEGLINCTRDLVADISKNLMFVFESYNKLNNKESLDAIRLATDKDISIEIESYRGDFRSQ